MGLLVLRRVFKVCKSVVKVSKHSQNCHNSDYKLTVIFHAFAELSENPNFFDVPSKLPFSRNN